MIETGRESDAKQALNGSSAFALAHGPSAPAQKGVQRVGTNLRRN